MKTIVINSQPLDDAKWRYNIIDWYDLSMVKMFIK